MISTGPTDGNGTFETDSGADPTISRSYATSGPITVGLRVFDNNVADDIVADLRRKGAFYRLETISHRYPHCWRCGTPLLFRLVDEWFISMGPVYARLKGLDTSGVATFMAVSILAAVVTQYPVGRLSDRMDRRTVIAIVCTIATLVARRHGRAFIGCPPSQVSATLTPFVHGFKARFSSVCC